MVKFSGSPWLKWWLTPKFPDKHIENILIYRPLGLYSQISNVFRTWIVHPFKRRIARVYVRFLQKFFGLKVVGITGSSGKTTTKEMIASILSLSGETIYSFANIDPIYNIPTTILRCKPFTKYLVLEMGVEYPNEMDFYLWLVRPNVRVITNIYPTHTLFFENEEGVFKEKSKLVKSSSDNEFSILNLENKYLKGLKGKLESMTFWFGKGSEIFASEITFTRDFKTKFTLNIDKQKVNINLPILGNQFVDDALACVSTAYALGIDLSKIKRGLESFKNQDHRMKIVNHKSGAVLIDDSYNNNPSAAKEAIVVLKKVAGKKGQ